jgi:hypothetical protein
MMVKASPTLPHITAATIILARQLAKREVKRHWHRQGIRWRDFEASELAEAAKSYLNKHPELIEQAAETVRNDPQLRTLAERQERQRKGNRR